MARHGWLSLALAACAVAVAAVAQSGEGPSDPTGIWQIFDDQSGQQAAAIRIYPVGAAFNGRIVRVMQATDAARPCAPCKDDRHNQPLLGLEILRGLRPDGAGGWSGGTIVDPDTGNIYSATAKLDGGGGKLIVRGYLLISLLGRNQIWLREP